MASKADTLYYASPAWLQNILVTLMGYRLYGKRYTGIYHELLAQVRQAREWSQAERDSYQSEQLHRMVKHCRQSIPFYQKLFADHGLHEQHITSLSDLRKIPLLDKQTVRTHVQDLKAPDVASYMQQNTSGSTGTPLTLAVDEKTYKMAMALLVEHEEYHGVPFGSPRATFAGRMVQRANDTSPPFSRYNRAENQKLYSSYHLNEATFPCYREDLDRFAPKELIGYPSAIADLASHYLTTDTRPAFTPEIVVTNSETLLDWQRERIERVFGCPVRDYYGTAEYVIFASQDKDGIYRTNPVLGISEVLRESGSDEGELVATTLTNRAMPLLRYRIGDTATVPPEGKGSNIRADGILKINGRVDDYIETPDGRKIGRIDHIFKGVTGIREAQVIQDQIDHCTIRVVLDARAHTFDPDTISSNLRNRTGPDMRISIERTESIERGANGKFKSVVGLKT